MPRELTVEEVRDEFLDHVRALIGYWAGEEGSNVPETETVRGRLEGLAFSILVVLDGSSSLPKFVVAPDPHPDDKAFAQKHGNNWYPEALLETCDISGVLHELLARGTS